MDNTDLRKQAAQAITNYMHHELFEIGGTKMIPWFTDQGNEIMAMVDRAIANTREEGKRRGII